MRRLRPDSRLQLWRQPAAMRVGKISHHYLREQIEIPAGKARSGTWRSSTHSSRAAYGTVQLRRAVKSCRWRWSSTQIRAAVPDRPTNDLSMELRPLKPD